MISFHVIDRLPLWIEGDLSETEARQVSQHLSGCASCRAAAEALQESQSWLKDAPPPPFDENDFIKLRRNVLEQLATQELPPSRLKVVRFYQWGPLVAAAAALLLIFLNRWTRTPEVSPRADPEKRASSSSNPRLALPPTQMRPPVQVPTVAPVRPLPDRQPVVFPSKVGSPEILVEIPSTQVRIELQTSNPAIRIIWLPRSPAEPLSTPEQARLS